MKIYNRVVIDIETLKVLEEDSFEYEGPIAKCFGGGKTETTTITYNYNYDAEYNARLATIAERQQEIADEYHTFWQDYQRPHEIALMEANEDLIPVQLEQARAEVTALKANTKAMLERTAADVKYRGAQTAGIYQDISESKLSMEQMRQEMGFAEEEMGEKRKVWDYAADVREFQREKMDWEEEERDMAKPVLTEYYKQALSGIDPQEQARMARADVAGEFQTYDEAAKREASRLGISPGSGAYANRIKSTGIEKAKAVGSAMTQAKTQANELNFSRLKNAATTYKGGIGQI